MTEVVNKWPGSWHADNKTASSFGLTLPRLKRLLMKRSVDQSKVLKCVNPLPYYKLFQYSTAKERLMILVGCVSALLAGMAFPLKSVLLGNLVSRFVQASRHEVAVTGNLTHQTVNETNQFNTTAHSQEGETRDSLVDMLESVVSRLDPRDGLLETVETVAVGVIVIGVLEMVLTYVAIVLLKLSSYSQATRIRQMYLRAVLRQDITWYDTNHTRDYASRSTDDITKFQDGIGDKLVLFLLCLSSITSSLTVSLITGVKLTLTLISCVPIIAMTLAIMAKFQVIYLHKETQAYANSGGIAEEVFSAIKTVVAFGGEQKEAKRYEQGMVQAKSSSMKKNLATAIGGAVTYLVLYGVRAGAVWYGFHLVVAGRSEESPEYDARVFVIIMQTIVCATKDLAFFPQYLEAFSMASSAAAHVFQLIQTVPKIDSSSSDGLKPAVMLGGIVFNHVHFRFPSRPDVPVLQGFNIKINKGETVALVGSSGCGKSAALSLLQRFFDVDIGSITVDGIDIRELSVRWLRQRIGVVGQEPVLFATTIAENIRYGNIDATTSDIQKAAKEANAHDFIMKLPNNYETVIGEKGSQLSGGQKQRIAIARALVRNPEILLLDEATSALDNESERIVQETLEKASKCRTTIVVAHRLSTVRNADKIVVVQNGRVVEQGSHNELMKRKSVYSRLVRVQKDLGLNNTGKHLLNNECDYDSSYESGEEITSPEISTNDKLARAILHSSMRKQSLIHQSTPDLTLQADETYSFKQQEVEEQEEEASLLRIIQLNKPESPYLAVGLMASILLGIIKPIMAIVFGDTYGALGDTNDSHVLNQAVWLASVFLGTGVIVMVANFLQMFMLSTAGENMTLRVRKDIFVTLLLQRIPWYDNPNNSVGAVCSRLSDDAASLQGAGGVRLATLLQVTTTLFGSVLLALYIHWRLAAVGMVALPFVIITSYFHGSVTKKQALNRSKALQESNNIASEAISSFRTVTSLGIDLVLHEKYVKSLYYHEGLIRRRIHQESLAYGIFQFVTAIGFAGCTMYGGYLITTEGMEYSVWYKVQSLLLWSTASIGHVLAFTPNYTKGLVAASRIFKILRKKEELEKAVEGVGEKLNVGYVPSLEFRDVSFAYPTRPSIPVLQGLNLKIKSGQTVAIVGSSGCGKSTCVQLLQRFYEPSHGRLILDNKDIAGVNMQWLRAQFGPVFQEPMLFNCTIAQNIAYGDNSRQVTMAEIIEAARQANIHEFIMSLPAAYETQVGERDAQLSGGQKQRIAIARALVRNPKIMLLDEATSALDSHSEQIVQEALDRARVGRTCITIAHRLSTIQNADVIVVIQNGHVVEQGTHTHLMSKKGLYYRLCGSLVRHK